MSRYDWPAAPGSRKGADDPSGRADFNARRSAGLKRADALAQLHVPAPAPAPSAGLVVRPRAPASSDNDLWQPLGPATLLSGQAEGRPRVCGRVNMLALHPDGQRAYAAAANGGVWATTDGGAHWRSVGGLASTPLAGINRPAHRNSCGAIHVVWRSAADGGDLVLLGTGEPHAGASARAEDGEYGLGVFTAIDPASSAADDPWSREAPSLINDAVYAFASNASGSEIYAATRTGLYQRPAGLPAADKAWTRITVPPFDQGDTRCTYVLYTPEEPAPPANAAMRRPGRLWVWLQDGASFGLFVRDDGSATFNPVPLSGAGPAGVVYERRRCTLAAAARPAPAVAGVVWALMNRGRNIPPALFRITNPPRNGGAPQAQAVHGVLNIVGAQGHYNLALAVSPANEERVAMAGSFLGTPGVTADAPLLQTPDNATRVYDASIMVDTVVNNTPVAGQRSFGATPGVEQFKGMGVHPDVHALTFDKTGNTLWAACDGGLYRSDRLASSAGFYARNNGLSISETNYIACHPTSEGEMLCGLQDNGTIERLSANAWRVIVVGDGGGLVYEPRPPRRFLAQSYNGTWSSETAPWGAGPLYRANPGYAIAEVGASAFYSQAALIVHQRGPSVPLVPPVPVSQVLIGSYRLWYSETHGARWITLPTGLDPLPAVVAAPAPPPGSPPGSPAQPAIVDTAQDSLGEAIIAARWQDPDTAWVLAVSTVYRYDRVPGSHANVPPTPPTWSIARVLSRTAPPTGPSPRVPRLPASDEKSVDPPLPAGPALPMLKATTWTEIEPNLIRPALPAAPIKALYLGTSGHPDDAAVDTLWWYDGDPATPRWWPTGLRSTGASGSPLPAAVTALVVDPELPDEVWVGTNVGVWKGVRSAQASPPAAQPWKWTWQPMLNGLPEAGVEDLAIFRDTYTVGATTQTLRLLRAAIGSRGVWELRLDQQAVPSQTYLRVHAGDMRHRSVARLTHGDGSPRSWHASPDIRPRLCPGVQVPPGPPVTGWTRANFPAGFTARLRAFQAALRKKSNDPRILGNGVWDGYFSELLRENGADETALQPAPAAGLKAYKNVVVTPAYWGSVLAPAHRSAEPWGPGRPSEADLYELTDPLTEGDAGRASCSLPRKPWRIEVVVHHRGRQPRPGNEVRVTLLYWADLAPVNRALFNEPGKWAPGNIGWASAVNTLMNSASSAAVALPSGWDYVGKTNATRRVDLSGQTLDPLNPGIASFDFTIPAALKIPPDGVLLLVAVIRAGSAPLALPNVPLQQLAAENDAVAVRAVHIV